MSLSRLTRRAVAPILLAAFSLNTRAADTPAPPQKITAQQDHAQMMQQLGITSLRPGANGNNRNAPNYQNTDESKANPYPNLPDPLTLNNGQKVTTPEQWWNQRRPEI